MKPRPRPLRRGRDCRTLPRYRAERRIEAARVRDRALRGAGRAFVPLPAIPSSALLSE